MRLKRPKELVILSHTFKITYNPKHSGGRFSFSEGIIEIGTKCIKREPLYTFGIISHEVMEVILVAMGCRYDNPRLENAYLFSFNHQSFENAIEIHADIMSKFIYSK